MATTNYLNPASFIPPNEFKASGPLGGVLLGQQIDDYRALMEQQKFLQQLAVARAQQEQKEFMEGAPLRSMQGEAQQRTLQGQMPYLSDLAAQTAQTGARQQQFTRDTQLSPEAKEEYFRQLRSKVTDDQWKQYERDLAAGATVTNTALQIEKAQGKAPALAYVQQQMQRLKQAGITLPAELQNPETWAPMHKAAVDSISQIQAIEREKEQNKGALERVKEQGRTQLQVAEIGARARESATERPPRTTQEQLARLREQLADPALSQEDRLKATQQYRMILDMEWQKQLSNRVDLQMLNFRKGQPGQAGIDAGKQLEMQRQDFYRMHGLSTSKATENRIPKYNMSTGKVE